MIHRPTEVGTEDFVAFDTRPERERVQYELETTSVAGLRLVENVLEFLDDEW